METITTNVYRYSELSDEAKQKANVWYSEGAYDYEWYEPIYEDAKTIGLTITGFGLDRDRRAEGHLNTTATATASAILKEHGEKTDTYKLAAAYLGADSAVDDDVQEERAEEFVRDLLEDYSIMLQRGLEYVVSDEAIAEAMEANEYTFTESGKRFG